MRIKMKFEQYLIESEVDSLKKELKDTDGYMKAPNGKKTLLTERQWLAVRTKAFKNWFGDWEKDKSGSSKALDANGEPIVVYHGTTAKFTRFEPERSGEIGEDFGKLIFFTDDHRVASGYSIKMSNSKEFNDAIAKRDDLWGNVSKAFMKHGADSAEFKEARAKWKEADEERGKHYDAIINYELVTEGSNVIAGFLNIRKPYVVDGKGLNWRKVHTEAFEYYNDNKEKYDGVIIKNVNDSATTSASHASVVYAFPKPNQVKSAIGNKGTFSKDSDELHESK